MAFSKKILIFLILFSLGLYPSPSDSADFPLKNDLAATAKPQATEAALEMFKKGGNAIDAAVAGAFALGVVEPENSGVGGGGFMMIYLSKTRDVVILDYREMAPSLSTPNIFQDRSPVKGYSAAAVPGEVKGLAEALKTYGRLPLREVVAPAMNLAEKGFPVSPLLAEHLKNRESCLTSFEGSREVFFKEGHILTEGNSLIQKDLGNLLKSIGEKGEKAFYEGKNAEKISKAMKDHEGLIRLNDLKDYSVKQRIPIEVDYRGYHLFLMPPPSSGGILMTEMFQMLKDDPLGKWGWASPREAHLLAEVMKLAFYDRARFLGDEDFVKIPREKLLSPQYAEELRKKISMEKVLNLSSNTESSLSPSPPPSPSRGEGDRKGRPSPLKGEGVQKEGGYHTTHATFADREGNIVTMTNSLNLHFGSCVVVPGTGILLNNHMDDFTANPGKANAFGLVQGDANEIQPRKRPLSTMSPTLIFKDGRPVYALGSPGGATIATNVFQTIINLIDHRMSLSEAVGKPKLHHQFEPDVLRFQKDYPELTLQSLKKMGHPLQGPEEWGNLQAIQIDWESGKINGVSDPRGEGVAEILQVP